MKLSILQDNIKKLLESKCKNIVIDNIILNSKNLEDLNIRIEEELLFMKWREVKRKLKNTLGDLNNHLFAQLERLGDEDIKGDELSEEIERAKTITVVAKQVIDNASLVLEAQKIFHNSDKLNADAEMPKMLEG